METKSFKDLLVWQKAFELVEQVYQFTKKLPVSEQFAIASQAQRAAVSIPSNIAEGYRRKGRPEYIQFLSIADGSAAELETQLLIINKVYSLDASNALTVLSQTQKMLGAMLFKLKTAR